MSTVPIGSNQRVQTVIRNALERRGIQAKVEVSSNPEFLREGEALFDLFYPDRVVVGAESPEAVRVLHDLCSPILEQSFTPPPSIERSHGYKYPPFLVVSPTSAELIKYASNAFLATKISFINEIAGLSERLGADVANKKSQDLPSEDLSQPIVIEPADLVKEAFLIRPALGH